MGSFETAWAWGWGEFGRLGTGDTDTRSEPEQLRSLAGRNLRAVACGAHHSACLTDRGELLLWGWNNDGQLGNGSTFDSAVPAQVQGLDGRNIFHVACGWHHTVAITESGDVYSWGRGQHGQLGHGDSSSIEQPKILARLSDEETHTVAVAAGASHTICLTDGGDLWAFGQGGDGQLGTGSTDSRFFPSRVVGLHNRRITQIACGANHSLALDCEGSVYTWGCGDDGRLGHGSCLACDTPSKVETFEGIICTCVAGGSHHSGVVTKSGQAFMFGRNTSGQLGIRVTSNNTACFSVPTAVESFSGSLVKSVSCGDTHTLFLLVDGSIFAAGAGDDGQLGIGTHNRESVPRPIKSISGAKICQVACGLVHSLACREVDRVAIENMSDLQDRLRTLTIRLQQAEIEIQAEKRSRILAEKRMEDMSAILRKKYRATRSLSMVSGSSPPGTPTSTPDVADVGIQVEIDSGRSHHLIRPTKQGGAGMDAALASVQRFGIEGLLHDPGVEFGDDVGSLLAKAEDILHVQSADSNVESNSACHDSAAMPQSSQPICQELPVELNGDEYLPNSKECASSDDDLLSDSESEESSIASSNLDERESDSNSASVTNSASHQAGSNYESSDEEVTFESASAAGRLRSSSSRNIKQMTQKMKGKGRKAKSYFKKLFKHDEDSNLTQETSNLGGTNVSSKKSTAAVLKGFVSMSKDI